MKVSFVLLLLFISGNIYSQLSFCSGSKGDPIFHETFGVGVGTGNPLPPGVTSYTYVVGDPDDGEYTISSNVGQNNPSWHTELPQSTLSNGKALIVNADDVTAGIFYERKISGLCEATTYEFSAFLMSVYNAATVNLCEGAGIPINVRFEIWDETGAVLLKGGSTGDIQNITSPKWEQYALVFRSQVGQSDVILRMFNNGIGGCGNDLAIDDIIFRSCGDHTVITSETNNSNPMQICKSDTPLRVQLTATPDGSVYTSLAFQWQESADEENWQDLQGETNRNFSSPTINSTRYFRVKVAEDPVNLNDNLCSSASQPFAVIVTENPNAPISLGDKNICEGDNIPPLEVSVEPDESVRWFGIATGGMEIASGETFIPPAAGIYYAGAVKTEFDCASGSRTPVTLNIFPRPEVTDENLYLCSGSKVLLDAGEGNFNYSWSTGATTQQIIISQPGNYSVTVSSPGGCSAKKQFQILGAEIPEISRIISKGSTVIIQSTSQGNFEYSLDGINFQGSNIFRNIQTGIYSAYIRDMEGCNEVFQQFPHIVVPEFITPNDDGSNDRFELKGIEYFRTSEVRIFDRFGKILAIGSGEGFSWDGTYNGKELPVEDYWYHIIVEDFEPMKGHFTLKR